MTTTEILACLDYRLPPWERIKVWIELERLRREGGPR